VSLCIGQVVVTIMVVATMVFGCDASKNGPLDTNQSDGSSDGQTDWASDGQGDGAGDGAKDGSAVHGCLINSNQANQCPPMMHCSFWHSCCDEGAACAYHLAGGDSGVPIRGVSCTTDDMCLATEYCQSDNQCCRIGYVCLSSASDAGSTDSGDGTSDAPVSPD